MQGVQEARPPDWNLSKDILYSDFFAVTSNPGKSALPLPFGVFLTAGSAADLRERMAGDEGYVRAYGKNKMFSGKHIAAKIWVGNYTTGESFEELARQSEGIERIGILRADVDNLGQAFVSGFAAAPPYRGSFPCFSNIISMQSWKRPVIPWMGGKKKSVRSPSSIPEGTTCLLRAHGMIFWNCPWISARLLRGIRKGH